MVRSPFRDLCQCRLTRSTAVPSVYRKSDTVSLVPFLHGTPTIYTANVDIAKQVAVGGHKVPWIKPESMSMALLWVTSYFISVCAEADTAAQDVGNEPRGSGQGDLEETQEIDGPCVQQRLVRFVAKVWREGEADRVAGTSLCGTRLTSSIGRWKRRRVGTTRTSSR